MQATIDAHGNAAVSGSTRAVATNSPQPESRAERAFGASGRTSDRATPRGEWEQAAGRGRG
jgi:hypothetical protein